MKIYILDDYIRTPDEFRGSPDIYQSAGGRVIGTPGGTNGPTWALCERGGGLRAGRPPLEESKLDKEGGGAPSFPPSLPLLPSPFPLLVGLGKGESYSYLDEDSSPPWRALGPAGLPPCSFIYGGRGTL